LAFDALVPRVVVAASAPVPGVGIASPALGVAAALVLGVAAALGVGFGASSRPFRCASWPASFMP
jgi:hypothetical protein